MCDDINTEKVKKSKRKEKMNDEHHHLHHQQDNKNASSTPPTTTPSQTASSSSTPGQSAKHSASKSSKHDADHQHSGGSSEKHSLFSRHKSLVKPTSSVRPKNFKRKLIALMKKIRPKSEFDNEEQYREALKRELLKAAAGAGKDTREIEELLEDGDLEDTDGANVGSDDEELDFDWDSISYSSTPKPSLRPFFSSTTLDKI